MPHDTVLTDGIKGKREFHNFLPRPYHTHKSGIYSIVNQNNGKMYVGGTANLSHRCTQHRHSFARGNYHSLDLQNDFKNDPDAFYVEVIEEIPNADKRILLEREQFWLNFFKPYLPQNGYNISPTAESCKGIKRRREYVERVANSLRGYKHTAEARANMSAGQTGIKRKKRTPEQIEAMRKMKLGSKWTPGQREKMERWRHSCPAPCNKAVVQLSLDGKFVAQFDSITKAEQIFGRRSNIHSVCKGKRNECFGFVWRYVNAT